MMLSGRGRVRIAGAFAKGNGVRPIDWTDVLFAVKQRGGELAPSIYAVTLSGPIQTPWETSRVIEEEILVPLCLADVAGKYFDREVACDFIRHGSGNPYMALDIRPV